ncbi:hypothetical protein D3C72_1128920 [compost metagenome]
MHAGFDVADVGFRDFGPNGHRRQFGDAQNQWCLLLGIEGLAFTGIECDHGAGHRRVNSCVAEFGLIAAQAGLSLANLRLEHVDPRLGGAQFRLGGLHVFFAGGAAGLEVLLTLEFLPGQFMQCLLLLQLRLEVFDGETPGVEFGLLRGRIDFHQQLAFLDHIADFHMNLVDLPGRLGADVDIATRLQGAQCRDTAFDVGAGDLHGGELITAGRDDFPGGDGDDGDQAECDKQGASGVTGTFHAVFRPKDFGPSFSGGKTGSCPLYVERPGEFSPGHMGLHV